MTARRASYQVHVVALLQWERERRAFQINRLHFVAWFDTILNMMENDARARYLTLGGETVPLEDYLALRPEAWERIEALVHDGRLIFGPLFIQTDPLLVHPEALIRNLLVGARMGQAFDYPTSKTAYFPLASGLPAQLPQLLQGFDLAGVVVTRGYDTYLPELVWFAPDGSRIPLAVARAPFPDMIAQRAAIIEHSVAADLLALYPLDPDAPPFAPLLNEHLPAAIQQTQDTFFKSTFDAYFEKRRDQIGVSAFKGELHSPKHTVIGQGMASAQLPLKRRNAEIETLLTRWAEPFTAWAEVFATHNPNMTTLSATTSDKNIYQDQSTLGNSRTALQLAWRSLLENQTPEVLAGSIPDEVQPDVQRRFDHAAQIAETLTKGALQQLARALTTGTTEALAVFNPSPVPRTDIVIVNGESYIAENVPPLGCLILPDAAPIRKMPLPQNADLTIENEFIRVQVDPFGPVLTLTDKQRAITYRRGMMFICEGDQGDVYNFDPIGRGIQNARRLHTDDLWSLRTPDMERLHYAVSLTLDPAPEMEPPPTDKPLLDLQIEVELRLIRAVPRLECTLTIHNTLKNYRLRVCFPLPFTVSEVIHDAPFEIVTRPVQDLPAVSPPEGYAETPLGTIVSRSFVAAFNPDAPRNGLIIAHRGIPESEIITDEDGRQMFALTVLRSVGYLHKLGVNTRAQDREAQDRRSVAATLPGAQIAEFALIPADTALGFDQTVAYSDGSLRAFVTNADHPIRQSLIVSSDSRFQISTTKLPETGSGLIVRGYNTGTEEIEVRLTPFRAFAVCDVVRMDETPTGGRLALESDGSFSFFAAPHRILTFHLFDL